MLKDLFFPALVANISTARQLPVHPRHKQTRATGSWQPRRLLRSVTVAFASLPALPDHVEYTVALFKHKYAHGRSD